MIKPIEAKLIKIEEANDRIKYFDYSFSLESGFAFIPGQFISAMMPAEPRPVPRPYSIASTPTENSQGVLKLVVTAVPGGKVSNWFHSLHEGDLLSFKGPFGKFILPEQLPEEIHFVSVGTGVAPFRSMILDLYDKGTDKKIYLYHGNRHEDSILYDDDFVKLEKEHPSFVYMPCVSRPKDPKACRNVGYVQEKVKEVLTEPGDRLVFICGINNMIDEVCQVLAQRGFPKESIHFERYD